jgi:hypothetical protein
MTHRLAVLGLAMLASPALAGPPYVTDDPEPTDYQHYEIYAFAGGTFARDGLDGETGIDFNYGGAPDLQLTAVLPMAYSDPRNGPVVGGLGNVELAAKYRFLRQDTFGWDVAVFPRVFLPSASAHVGEQHASFFLPVFVEKDWDKWSMFGGGGCTLDNGGGSKDFCQAGWALTREVLPDLHIGAEIYHQTADTRGGRASTGIGFGATYDLSENYHLMASAGPGIQNAADTNRDTWYAAMLFTF